jgi:membrane-associated phospholipid phosphatase
VIWILAGDIRVIYGDDPRPLIFLLSPVLYIALVRLFPPRKPMLARVVRRLDLAMQGLVFIHIGWIAATLLNHLSMTVAFPYADPVLADWDAALGFDWHGYFNLVLDNPALRAVLEQSYNVFMQLCLAAFLVLALSEDLRRAAFMVEAFFLTAVVCIFFGVFFPAEGSTMHFLRGAVPEDQLRQFAGLYHLEDMYRLRSDQVVSLDPLRLHGLVTFPSFHTAGIIVVAVALWRTPWFWPGAAYAAVMIASTPVFGAHYVIDLVAGAAAAAAVLGWLASSDDYRGVLRAPSAGGIRLSDLASLPAAPLRARAQVPHAWRLLRQSQAHRTAGVSRNVAESE